MALDLSVECESSGGIERSQQFSHRLPGQYARINVPVPDRIAAAIMGHPTLGGAIRSVAIDRFYESELIEALCRHLRFPKGTMRKCCRNDAHRDLGRPLAAKLWAGSRRPPAGRDAPQTSPMPMPSLPRQRLAGEANHCSGVR
jgi:hypothetical protein